MEDILANFDLETIIAAMAGGIAGALVLFTGAGFKLLKKLAGKTKTDFDDKLLDAIAEKVKEKIKD